VLGGGGARNVHDFDALPIPFRAVATDMVSGSIVVLRNGDLSVAMRASMAVPGAFSPVVIGDQALAARSLDVMIDANSKAQLATLTERYVSIVVQMGDIGSGSFERVPDAIPLGRVPSRQMPAGFLPWGISSRSSTGWWTHRHRARSSSTRSRNPGAPIS